MIRLFVPFLGPSTNVGIRQHWRKHKAQVDECYELAREAIEAAGIAPVAYPCHLTFIPQLGKGDRRRDTGNYSISCKVVEDGLVRAGILEDDRGEFVRRWQILPPIVDRQAPSGTWVEITPAEEAA